jgi:cell division protein FtsI (penicillin-binding protein 3)
MEDVKSTILSRVYILYAILCVFGFIILAKVFYIQVVLGPELREKAEDLTLVYKKIEPLRGNIFSGDGKFLAISVPIYELRMDMRADGLKKETFDKNLDSLSISLANLFQDRSKNDYKNLLNKAYKRGDRYLFLKKGVSFSQLQKVQKFPLFRMGANRGGLIVLTTNKRIKPYKSLAGRTIGSVGEKNEGNGLEGSFNEYLTGTEGLRLMQKLSSGLLKPVTEDYEVEPENGADLYTTIDVNLQDVAQDELRRQLTLHNADHGCVVMMEVKTGEIKAISNLTKLSEGNYSDVLNYAIWESAEPGSTFKLASLMAALEDGLIKFTDSVSTGNGTYTYANGAVMRDSHEGGYGIVSVKKSFEVSSNVAVSKLIVNAYKKDPQKFINRLKRFHLHEKLNTELTGEGSPEIKETSDKYWSKTSLPWMSIGYETKLTPLQILTFYNAVANNGKMIRPRFVKEIRRRGEPIMKFEPEVIDEQIASPTTIQYAKEMLEGVVENGTAKNLRNLPFKIAGKTGTAQVSNGKAGYIGANGKTYRASFVGYFPADAPKYSCIVVVSAPSNSVYYGNLVAGPIFKAVSEKIYAASLDIHPKYNKGLIAISDTNKPAVKNGWIYDSKVVLNKLNISNKTKSSFIGFAKTDFEKGKIVFFSKEQKKGVIPDVRGMGARDAVFVLENSGVKVKISGKGAVNEQYPQPGTAIKQGETVTLVLG